MVGQAVVHLGCEPVNDYMAAPATHLVGPSSAAIVWEMCGAAMFNVSWTR